jgi:putative endopeptidase
MAAWAEGESATDCSMRRCEARALPLALDRQPFPALNSLAAIRHSHAGSLWLFDLEEAMPRASIVLLSAAVLWSAGPPQARVAKTAFGAWGVDLSGMDTGVKPGDDFFDYVNGKWVAATVIPPDRSSIGSFQNLQILSEQRMEDIVADLEKKPASALDAEQKKLRDLYEAFTDTAQIEKLGLAPVQKALEQFAAFKTPEDVARAMAGPAGASESLFGASVIPDAKDSNRYIVTLSQSGLGMPAREYYLADNPDLVKTRDAYKGYLSTMLGLAWRSGADERASAVLALETAIARDSWTAADRRDADRTYNPMTVGQLESEAPGFPWAAFFEAYGVTMTGPAGPRSVIVREKTAFPALAKTFAATPVRVWGDWLTVRYLHDLNEYLPKPIEDADFAFYGKVISGTQEPLPRATRGVRLLDRTLGHPLGKIYVAKYFPPTSKVKVEALVANLLKAYDADIRQLPWMTEATRQKALAKLHAFVPHVGYPDRWRDYSALTITRTDLAGDIERSRAFERHYRLARLDARVDRNEWNMTPPTINAYYTPLFNSIFFPAAILQAPFFDPDADPAVNYGAIGAVIGHEISHGFDDQGSKYDADGTLRSWWTEADRAAFEERVSALGAQYDTYEPLPGLHVNGKLTMGENIGDLSGLTIALKAYHLSLAGQTPSVLDGFTGDQRAFLGFAQIWRSKYRDGAMRQQVLSNPHSPAQFRVIGPTRNIDEWYQAFNVGPGDRYYLGPDRRVHLW